MARPMSEVATHEIHHRGVEKLKRVLIGSGHVYRKVTADLDLLPGEFSLAPFRPRGTGIMPRDFALRLEDGRIASIKVIHAECGVLHSSFHRCLLYAASSKEPLYIQVVIGVSKPNLLKKRFPDLYQLIDDKNELGENESHLITVDQLSDLLGDET